MRTSLAIVASFAALLLAAPANAAATYTWTTDSGGTVNNSNTMTFGSNQNVNEKVKVTAYQIGTLASGGAFATAGLAQYSGGLGVTSKTANSSGVLNGS